MCFWLRKRKTQNGNWNKEQLCLSDSNGHAGSDPNCENAQSEANTVLCSCARFNLHRLNLYIYSINIVPLQQRFLVSAPVSSVRAILFHVPCIQEMEVKTTQTSKAKQFN